MNYLLLASVSRPTFFRHGVLYFLYPRVRHRTVIERTAKVYEPYQQEEERRLEPKEQTTRISPGRLVTLSDPTSATADAYRVLGANLRHALTDTPSKVIA